MRTYTTLAIVSLALLGCPAEKPAQSKAPAQPKTAAKAQPKAAASQPSAKASKGTTPADRGQVDSDGIVRRGNKLSEKAPLTVAQLITQSDQLKGQTVMVKGKIESVCQKKGCWMVIKDGDQSVRITSKGYKFFVPKTAPGQQAIVEGELAVKTLDVETAQHYEEERVMGKNEKPKKITAPKKEASVAAIGLEIRKAG